MSSKYLNLNKSPEKLNDINGNIREENINYD